MDSNYWTHPELNTFRWVWTGNFSIPMNSYRGGKEEGQYTYIARTWHHGGLYPGSITPGDKGATVAWNGEELMNEPYEVLQLFDSEWKKCTGGKAPRNAVWCCFEPDGEPIFIGQVKHKGNKYIGKVRKEFKGCNFVFGGKEITKDEYKVLTCDQQPWMCAKDGEVPPHAMVGGHEEDGEKLYIGRCMEGGRIYVGKVRAEFGGCNIPLQGGEMTKKHYQVFKNIPGDWIDCENGQMPDGAYHCGKEMMGAPVYMARAEFNGGLHPGIIGPDYGGVKISFGGEEHLVENYQVFKPHHPTPGFF